MLRTGYQRGLLAIALCVALYALVARMPRDHTTGERTVTHKYDGVGCGRVRDVSASLTGSAGKAMTLCLLNFERAQAGLAPLVENRLLDGASERHSADMEARTFFEHVNPDGVDPQTRIASSGYVPPGGWTGENIAWGNGALVSPAAIVDDWMHSPGHRENILRPTFREVGIGIALGRAPKASADGSLRAATYTTDFGG